MVELRLEGYLLDLAKGYKVSWGNETSVCNLDIV